MSAFNINRGSSAANPFYMQLSAGIIQPVRTVTANDTATVDDYLILADATAGTITETLPAGLSSVQTCVLVVKKKDSSANTVTVSAGASTIDGQSSLVLYTQNSSVTLQWNGTAWTIEAFDPGEWGLWTPTFSCSGSMTISGVTLTMHQFVRYHSEVSFELAFSATLGGTASTSIFATLPTPNSNADNTTVSSQLSTTSGFPVSGGFITVASGLNLFAPGVPLPNYPLGSVTAWAQARYPI